ncbi:MAG TPA: hypothetical protein VGX91_09855 [Candidatus Cybelea sp.]|nr:hypothetical protein [Candidatus Cybelea sp.]
MIIGGAVFMAGAAAFFWGMAAQMPRSNDPQSMMHEVGQVSGFVGAIGLALLIAGLFGWQGLSKKL